MCLWDMSRSGKFGKTQGVNNFLYKIEFGYVNFDQK